MKNIPNVITYRDFYDSMDSIGKLLSIERFRHFIKLSKFFATVQFLTNFSKANKNTRGLNTWLRFTSSCLPIKMIP